MKHTNKVFVVALALAIAVSCIAVTTLTTGAATEINPYAEVKFGEALSDYDKVGTTYDGDHLELKLGDNNSTDPNFGGVGTTYNGAWMKYENVAFGDNGATSVTIKYGSKASRMAENAEAEIWIDGKSATEGGTKVGTVELPVPEDREADYQYGMTSSADLTTTVKGTHVMYVVLTGTTDVYENEYVANLTTFVFTEAEAPEATATPDNNGDQTTQAPEATATPDNNGDQTTQAPEATATPDNNDDAVVATKPTLGKTDNKVLFYTDFSDASKLVVKEVDADRDHVDAANDKTVEPTLDADGNMVMSLKQYIDLGIDSLKGQKEITIEFVIKPSEIIDHAAFAGIGCAQDNGWMVLGMQNGGALKFGMKSNDKEIGGAGSGKTEEGLLVVDQWVKVKYVITETDVTIFVNDVEVKNPDKTATMTYDMNGQMTLDELANLENASFAFGQQTKWDDAGFVGAISEIRVSSGVVVSVPGDDNGSTNNGSANNGSTNNGSTNNGSTNNGASNNASTNNGSTNNGSTNNGSTNNGASNNNSNNGSANNDAGNSSTSKPVTGDVASVAAILAAGVAALGGLKLRKKSK